MRCDDFKDLQGTAKLLNYKIVPLTSVAILKYSRTPHTVDFKTSHDKLEPENSANIKFAKSSIRGSKKHIKQTKDFRKLQYECVPSNTKGSKGCRRSK
ncbi:hypothetical protein AVEN_210919-1 [Araneus ventricosus]|uniref:Uncharacterized protein n=1 Tax=Araneus ventricosus TaxID=182803 RepID=A0A4Y2PVT9_ARAVE|nr:hypothetical protein AVEN_210919-1 [Araneus ventricosus]